jgi:UPF0176 protein
MPESALHQETEGMHPALANERRFINIAAYRFIAIRNGATLGARLLERSRAVELRGSVLIAPEGINLFVAGLPEQVETWLAELVTDERFHGLAARRSWSATQPFGRMRVRLKTEIIRMNRPEIAPAAGRAIAVSPVRLAQWLDQGCDDAGRQVRLLDARNAFEVDYGSFRGAMSLGLRRFSDFPARVAPHLEALRATSVVSFCTGGIRCEKARLFLQSAGLKHSYQLEGGILGYFDAVGSRHYTGSCFVFDGREALDPSLAPIADSAARSASG